MNWFETLKKKLFSGAKSKEQDVRDTQSVDLDEPVNPTVDKEEEETNCRLSKNYYDENAAQIDLEKLSGIILQGFETNEKIAHIYDARKHEIAEIRAAAEAHFQHRRMEVLCGIGVDVLAQQKTGAPIAYLKNAGIMNLYQLSLLNYSEIRNLPGVGPQGAKKINELKHALLDSVKNDITLGIDLEDPDSQEKALVKAICIFLCHEDIRKECKKLHNLYGKEIMPAIEQLNEAKNRAATSLFSREYVSQLQGLLAEAERKLCKTQMAVVEALEAFDALMAAEETMYLAHFEYYSSFYYATIEKYCKKITSAQKMRNKVSEEFVKKIEAQSVNVSGLKGTLRPYQLFGVKYLIAQKYTLLGDEMGLGKTVQAIGAMLALKSKGKKRFLVVCPATVISNWIKEIDKFSNLLTTRIQGRDQESLALWLEKGGVAVTSYESVCRLDFPLEFQLDYLIVDEAHYVKNPLAKRTEVVLKLLNRSEYVTYMTGTPLVNNVNEMCFLISCLQPDVVANLDMVKSSANTEQFKHALMPVYLRRLSKDVATELPKLIRKDQWCALGEVEKAHYLALLRGKSLMEARKVSWGVDDMKECSKAIRMLELCRSAKEHGRKILIFSYFLETIDKVCSLLGDDVVGAITGKVTMKQREALLDAFNKAPGGSVLVCQILAGGVGLNIQAASVVIFCEPQLTPGAEAQALKRAHRMGQTREVLAYRLMAEDTVDERIFEILAEKQKDFDQYAAESIVADIYEGMNDSESGESVLARAIRLERERWQIS